MKLNTNFRALYLFLGLFLAVHHQAKSLNFSYPTFGKQDENDLQFNGNSTLLNALQVTIEARGMELSNFSGRVVNKTPVKLWSKQHKGGGRKTESFNTKFVFRITPETDPAGEGLAFILTKDLDYIPEKSYGQWLGIVNSTTNGSSSNPIVAIEFDTKKSFPEDLDNNHVGVDINSIYSVNQTRVGLNISSATHKMAIIDYNGTSQELKVYVFEENDTSNYTKGLVISVPLDLSLYLPEKVYVGFSASTGIDTQLNCVRSWYFTGVDVDSGIPKWVCVAVSLSCGILILVICCYVYWKIKKGRDRDQGEEFPVEDEIEITNLGMKKYRLKELKSATGNFNSKNELGRGGFGMVYKGNLKGEEVAVKRVWKNTRRGRKNMIAEITTIGSVHHKNVVKLIGWCYERDELLLVYEYMANSSLDKFLYPEGKQEQATFLGWERRYNIVCGVAQSIDYLHNECSRRVLHRDIKTSNIMLDAEFNACLGDFGLARMFKLSEKTHHTTLEIAGTPAYMAPEIFLTNQATVETDVYAFGVLMLEVVCGRKPEVMSEDGRLNNRIVDWVWELYRLDMICNAVDPNLEEDYDRDQARCLLLIGLACCNPNPHLRPTIRSVLQVLMREVMPPLVPYEKPAFVWPASAPSSSRETLDGTSSGGILSTLGSFNGR